MEIFTDIEKRILERTNKSYKWIARDKNGFLYIYDTKPYKDEGYGYFSAKFGNGFLLNECVSDVLFKNVTWENSPIQYRNNELLTPKEREYLKFVFKPFASNITYVEKTSEKMNADTEYIKVHIYKDCSILFPNFKKGIMYKGMKPKTKYTLGELGIKYNE